MCHTGWGISTEAIHASRYAVDAPPCRAEGGRRARLFPGPSEADLARTSLLTHADRCVSAWTMLSLSMERDNSVLKERKQKLRDYFLHRFYQFLHLNGCGP